MLTLKRRTLEIHAVKLFASYHKFANHDSWIQDQEGLTPKAGLSVLGFSEGMDSRAHCDSSDSGCHELRRKVKKRQALHIVMVHGKWQVWCHPCGTAGPMRFIEVGTK